MHVVAIGLVCVAGLSAQAADAPAPQQADWTARDFRFHTGAVLPALRLHYTTLGDPSGEPVLIMHGTAGTGAAMLAPAFGGQLFGPGQPLDAAKYFIILPDSIGAGGSSKPSDGLRAKFPEYDYADMVLAEYRLVTEGLGLHHLRLVLGNSMGGMMAWDWGITYPGMMDALVPMASQPTAMSARNWMLRRMLIETIRRDPAYQNGDYTTEPASLQTANVFFGLATSGGTLNYQTIAPHDPLGGHIRRQPTRCSWAGRCERLPLPVERVARLRRVRRGLARIDAAVLADQLRRRRTQSAGNRVDDGFDAAAEERPALLDLGQRRNARPWHHRLRQVLGRAAPQLPPSGAGGRPVACVSLPGPAARRRRGRWNPAGRRAARAPPPPAA